MNQIKFQIVVLDKTDYIIRYKTFLPSTKDRQTTQEMIHFIEEGMMEGDVKITRWDAKTGLRI